MKTFKEIDVAAFTKGLNKLVRRHAGEASDTEMVHLLCGMAGALIAKMDDTERRHAIATVVAGLRTGGGKTLHQMFPLPPDAGTA